jgi:uncharacterized protein involved in high-affinity Fe2+ transport
MDRRRFVGTLGTVGAVGLAGCVGGNLFQVRSSPTRNPPVVENRPDAVYYPSHVEGMKMAGMSGMAEMGAMSGMNGSNSSNGSGVMSGTNGSGGMDGANGSNGSNEPGGTNGSGGMATADAGEYAFGLMYSYPHRFWTVTGTERSKTALQDADSMHLMASVWNPATNTVLPDTGLSVEITRDGELVSQEVIYPMLSQQMGFHYGANFELPGEGTYTATLSVGAMSTRRTGAFRGLFSEPRSAEIDFEYAEAGLNEIPFRVLEEKAGTKGAVAPMDMETMPQSYAPERNELPGRVLGEGTSDDARFLVTVLDEPPEGVEKNGRYLAASARTPYNRLVIPSMALSGTLERGGETAFDGELIRTLDPDLGYHYGAAVESVQSGDRLTISVDTPPQTARHEGYETAFLGEMSEMTLTVP